MPRIAILMENGKEIFRGAPYHMPVQFLDADENSVKLIDWTMQDAVNNGTPIDDQGDDLPLAD